MQQINEAKFIENEVTLRNLELSNEITETRRSLVRWLALSLGIISPGESRQSAVSVLDSLLYFHFGMQKEPTIEELKEYIGKNWEDINEKTLRYHLLQLKKAGLIENSKGRYYIAKHETSNAYDENEWVNSYINALTEPIKKKVAMALKELKNR